jgi:hypothetical protein
MPKNFLVRKHMLRRKLLPVFNGVTATDRALEIPSSRSARLLDSHNLNPTRDFSRETVLEVWYDIHDGPTVQLRIIIRARQVSMP